MDSLHLPGYHLQICSFPLLASDKQRPLKPFLFDLDILIFLKFRELFLKNGMVALFPVKKKTGVLSYQSNAILIFLLYLKDMIHIGVTYIPYKFVIFHHILVYNQIHSQPQLT